MRLINPVRTTRDVAPALAGERLRAGIEPHFESIAAEHSALGLLRDRNEPFNLRDVRKSKKGLAALLSSGLCRASIFGAGDGIRTHDPNLGKVMLYP